MLKIIHKSTSVKLDETVARTFQGQLQGRFNSLLAGVRLEYARRLGLDDQDLTPPPVGENGEVRIGEIFLTQPGTVCFVRYHGESELLEASAISNSRDADLESFFSEVSSCLSNSGASADGWQDPDGASNVPEDAEQASTDVSEKELDAARELMNPESRQLLEQLAEQESILVREIDSKGVKELFKSLQHFEDLDLIRKDYAVIDQKTGQQILRVPSRASLEEASQKFFIGGTAISNDNVDEVISCTPFCRHLLSNDQWLLILLLGTLKELDLGPDTVYVVRSESAPSRVYLQTSRQRFLIVLSNRRLTLDDAYLIGAQVAAYDLKDIIVISTDRTSTLMRHHLRQTNEDASFAFVDALSNLESQLRSILLERQRSYLRDLLDPLAALTPVRVQDLIVRKMVPQSEEPEPAAEEEPAAAIPPAPAVEDEEDDPLPAPPVAEEDTGEAADEDDDDDPARAIADSFEAPAPDVLPAFEGEQNEDEASGEDEPVSAEEMAVPDVPDITEPPMTEDEPSEDFEQASEQVPVPEIMPDLPEAEELIPDLPIATEP